MHKLIEDLYYGQINVMGVFNPRRKEPFAKAIQAVMNEENSFVKTLNDRQKEDFFHLMEDYTDKITMEHLNMFSEGFRIGARLIIEVMTDEGTGYPNDKNS